MAELLFILSVVFCMVLAMLVHEGAHLLAGYIGYGLKPTGFYPIWHWYNANTSAWRIWRPWEFFKKPEGYHRFYFARYAAKGNWPLGKKEFIHIAPLVADGAMVVVGCIFMATSGSLFSVVFTCAFLFDALVWVRGYFNPYGRHTDGYKYRYGMKLP